MTLPKDRVVFITGGSGGIGHATARAFMADGARVAVCARSPIKDLDGALTIKCDVQDRKQVQQTIQKVVEKLGDLHILINNAGYGHYSSLTDIDPDDFESVYRTNVFAPLYCVQAAFPHLKKTKGQIINISSVLARATMPFHVPYCSSKYALHSFTEGLRIEMKRFGIGVIEIGPGLTATGFQNNSKRTKVNRSIVPDNQKGWSAEKVADIIVKASKKRKREVWLTFDGKTLIFVHDKLPRVADWGLGRWAKKVLKEA